MITGHYNLCIRDVNENLTFTGQKLSLYSLPVVLASDQSPIPVSGSTGRTWVLNYLTDSVSSAQLGVWNITNITGTISLPTGAATSANQATEITSLQLLDNIVHSNNVALNQAVPIMGQLDDTGTGTVTENNVSTVRITPSRAIHTNLRNSSGTEVGTSTNPIAVTPTPPQISKKLRVRPQTATIAVPSTVTYTTLYSRSGSGLLIGFNLEFNANRAVVKLDIDGETILDGFDIGTLNLLAVSTNTTGRQEGRGVITTGSQFDFSFKNPIAYGTSITISARLSSGASINFNQGMVYLTEET